MRLYHLLGVFIFLAAGLASTRAAEESAVVAEGKINVRGKPSLIGEVITQLEQGEKVTILERITNNSAKPGESTNWAKIKLPPNTPVWVFSPFVKDGVVNVSRLNIRAGRGENYSVIGRLTRGDEVKPIRTVEEWMEIQQPPDAYAFVDADLLKVDGAPTRTPVAPASTPSIPTVAQNEEPATSAPTTLSNIPPATANTEVRQPAAAIEIPTNATVVATAPTTVTPAESAAPKASTPAPETALPVPDQVQTTWTNVAAITSAPTSETAITSRRTNGAPVAATSPLPQTLPQVAPPIEKKNEPLPKRVVRREGIVRATTSIQAPTWYELEHAETKKRINYLFAEGMDINLKDYRGQKVVVTGEEAIDQRWPNTPILDMQTLDVLP